MTKIQSCFFKWFILTASSGYSKAVTRKKVVPVCSPLPPKLKRLLGGAHGFSIFCDASVCILCVRKWISFMCAENVCIKGSVYCFWKEEGSEVMSVNTATKAITHAQFSSDMASLKCCKTFGLSLQTFVTSPSHHC